MIILSAQQEKALNELELQKFKQETFDELQENWPDRCADLGDDQVWYSIDFALMKAKNYKISREVDVSLYLNCLYAVFYNFAEEKPSDEFIKEYENMLNLLENGDLPGSVKVKIISDNLGIEK